MNPDIQHSFKALADPTRRQILVQLSQKEMTIAEITDQFDMTRAAIKKHLNILESGSLISVKRNGRERINTLEAQGLKTITDWLGYFDQFWDTKLSRLQTAIAINESNENKGNNMSNSTIKKSAFFATTPETIWAYLTEADKLGEWFHPGEADLAANIDYALVAKNDDGETNRIIWGKVLIWDPTTRLQYTFEIGPFAGVSTTVTWHLEAAHGGTKLSLTHEGVGELGDASLNLLMALDDGWDEHIGSLRKTLKNEA